MSALAELSKRNRDTARGGGTGAAIGGGLTAAALGGAALKYRRGLKEVLRHGADLDDEIGMGPKGVKRALGIGAGVTTATGAGVGSAVGATVGRKRRNPGQELSALKKSFSTKDQNSSVGTTISWAKPKGPWQSASLKAVERKGAGGSSRGVGRHLTRDQNSSPGVVRLTPRSPSGKFVSHANDLQVFHPKGRKGRPSGQASRLERYGRGVGHGVKKALDFGNTGTVGRRIR